MLAEVPAIVDLRHCRCQGQMSDYGCMPRGTGRKRQARIEKSGKKYLTLASFPQTIEISGKEVKSVMLPQWSPHCY